MTLVLTFLCERYIVQCSDRRITYSDGTVSEVMNKAVVIGTQGCAAYTGLAFLNGRQPTDLTLMESIGESFVRREQALDRLAHDASRAVRMNQPLKRTAERLQVARTSLILAMFERPPLAENAVPTIHVISNAQSDLTEAWEENASRSFMRVSACIRPGAHLLHVAGQRLPTSMRIQLERHLRHSVARCAAPEAVARLLARAIQAVSGTNVGVGANVNGILVRPIDPPDHHESGGFSIAFLGPVPIGQFALREASFFVGPRGDIKAEPIRTIFLPDAENPQVAHGPSQVHPQVQLHSPIFGPDPIVSVITKALEDMRAGRPTDLALPQRFRPVPEPRDLP